MPAPPWKARIALPAEARRGEIVEVRTLIAHPMLTGFQRDSMGRRIERDIISRFHCRYGGRTAFAVDLFPAVSANPYLSFTLQAEASGPVVFEWVDEQERRVVETRTLTVLD